MAESRQIPCPNCGQQLRVPGRVGGLTLQCPACGHKFASDFRFGGVGQGRQTSKNLLVIIFELPGRVVAAIGRIFLSR